MARPCGATRVSSRRNHERATVFLALGASMSWRWPLPSYVFFHLAEVRSLHSVGASLLTYRCFILDSASHISERLSIECDSDEAAIFQAAAILERREGMAAIEVWDGTRLVQKLARSRS